MPLYSTFDCQVQSLARSFIEYDELGIDPAGNPEDISNPMAITDLEQMCVLDLRADSTAGGENDSDDNEEGLTSVAPPISLNEANLHLTALLT